MIIQKTNLHKPNFQAKFIHTQSIKDLAEFAVRTNRFDKLNKARKKIDNAYLRHRISFELSQTNEGIPIAIFTRYTPKKDVAFPKTIDDFEKSAPIEYRAKRIMNPLIYGYDIIRKLATFNGQNDMFKKIVAGL